MDFHIEKLAFQDLTSIIGDSHHGYSGKLQACGSEVSFAAHFAELGEVAGGVRSLLAAHLAADDRDVTWDVIYKLAGDRGRDWRLQTAKYAGDFLVGDYLGIMAHTNRFDGDAHSCLHRKMCKG